ncbi:hypothetical protein GGS23DRAFT_132708 [Durotheca rogersii]|uniref:uncharacterized protein n=1 Tax=Durotheca rogersii TaxID=419775 RepID=UPI00222058A3|nr:uncharacterized protein GGS23DRAFT_132708 [Durotheca rogersii]KAI5861811.1 hypothetical protein GGS23DRAFT_132708 [Durotheca rogersii]
MDMKDATKPSIDMPSDLPPRKAGPKDEWEDWDENTGTRVVAGDEDGLLIDFSNDTVQKSRKSTTTPAGRSSAARDAVQKPPLRVRSRARQRAQNARAGIKLVTDMTKFRRSATAAHKRSGSHSNVRAKYVDAAALHALEGEPSSASIGSFSWLKQKPGNMNAASNPILKPARPASSDLSPDARPIVIGISVPSDNLSEHQVSPYTAVIETPIGFYRSSRNPSAGGGNATIPAPLRSVWSPDTEASESPYRSPKIRSSVISLQPSTPGLDADAPPVPALPAVLNSKQKQAERIEDLDDDDIGTPCTLFEEDGSPMATRKSAKPIPAAVPSPASASSQAHGWWDHVTTPFLQQSSPLEHRGQETEANSPEQWNPFRTQAREAEPSASSSQPSRRELWAGADEKGESSKSAGLTIASASAATHGQQPVAELARSSSAATSSTGVETHSEKARILAEENQTPSEEPPPYSPPKSGKIAKYTVILPPSESLGPQPVPSPGPVTPGLPGTMTARGAINMSDIPLTPPADRPTQPAVALPDRAPGSYRPGDHFYEARGVDNRVERQRRRHEKEEVVARKAGGLWRGRGCIPEGGCFGRSGREGRKRRRICLAIIGGILAAIILAVVLAVVLTRRRPEDPIPSIWVNLTDFPPMPTGVLTVVGPDNIEARSGCLVATAQTAWSCSLPKEKHDSVAPRAPNQPTFIFQIQYDNSTRALWNIPNDDGTSNITDTGFTPDPAPPLITDIRFMGNTTDHIEADDKAGEPTPFFISLLPTVDETVGPNHALNRRQGINNAIPNSDDSDDNGGPLATSLSDRLPPPSVNGDGTGAPARMFPLPRQQPARLFDRGLPTEHYGFYTYFDKTIYLRSSVNATAEDGDGGAALTEAREVVTFAETRFLVQIWTRMENTTQLLGGNGGSPLPVFPESEDSFTTAKTPGTMPYPITVTEDMHGGDPAKKINYRFGVTSSGEINPDDAKLVLVDLKFAGTLVNGRNNEPDLSLGGIDGGTGGCNCVWVNFKGFQKVSST